METKYAIKVNGKFITNVVGKPDTTRNEFVAFVKTFGADFNDAKDTLEAVRIDEPEAKVLSFNTQSYMQISHFAIDVHLANLVETYGANEVIARFDKMVGIGRVA